MLTFLPSPSMLLCPIITNTLTGLSPGAHAGGVIGGTIGSGGGGGGGGGVEHAPFAHVQCFGQSFCVLKLSQGAGGGGGGGLGAGGGAGGGGGGGPGLMLFTLHAVTFFLGFWHPPLISFSVLNQQSAPSNTPAAHEPLLAHIVQHSSCVAALAESREPWL
jgi:hypothetical protein